MFVQETQATALLPSHDSARPPITVIGTKAIRDAFDEGCLKQARNAASSPGVSKVVINPDAHVGYGAPIGCVMASPSHIYPGPVGVDIKCSMSLLQLDLPDEEIEDKRVRRAIIKAICERTPTGAGKGQRSVPKARSVGVELGRRIVTEGASADVLSELGIPTEWADRCEDAFHIGHDRFQNRLAERLEVLHQNGRNRQSFPKKMEQLGSYGGGNHFGEAEKIELRQSPEAQRAAEVFGLKDGHVAFLSHCGSRGFGHDLASNQFRLLQKKFDDWGTPFPAGDRHLVYAPLYTQEANDYIDDMSLGANFATVNHLMINQLVLEAFQEVIPGVQGNLVYFISHNIARREILDDQWQWVHRKGATRAFPGGHPALKETPFSETGHPILLPGNPRDGSSVMAALPGAKLSAYSVNHGAGRRLGRRNAFRTLDQQEVDRDFEEGDIMTNCRIYPRDEAPDAYKNFEEVIQSVELAGLAHEIARMKARFVIKDGDKADD